MKKILFGIEGKREGFAAAFTDAELKKIRSRFKYVARGRDHVTKHDFLMMPEIARHPIVNRVIDVVLEETGQAAKRTCEGDYVEVKFDKKEYDLGIDWEPIPHQEIGIQIEEIHGGGSAFAKQQLQVGDDLIGYKFPLLGDGAQQQWNYVSGKQTKEIRKILKGIRRKRDLGARTAGPLHLLFLREEEDAIANAHARALKALMKATGALSDSEEDEEVATSLNSEIRNSKETSNSIVTEEYDVTFGIGALGFNFDTIPGQKTGVVITEVMPNSQASADGRIRKKHLITRISRAPPVDGLETRYRNVVDLSYLEIRKYLQKSARPVAITFARKIKQSRKFSVSKMKVEVKRRSRVFMRRSHLNYSRILWEDFVNILGCLSTKTPPEQKLRIAFRMWDTDNDGYIDEDDLYCILKEIYVTHCGAMGCQISDYQLEKMVECCLLEMDDSDDKLVDADEFGKILGTAVTEILTIAF